jgi:hypothetical protein
MPDDKERQVGLIEPEFKDRDSDTGSAKNGSEKNSESSLLETDSGGDKTRPYEIFRPDDAAKGPYFQVKRYGSVQPSDSEKKFVKYLNKTVTDGLGNLGKGGTLAATEIAKARDGCAAALAEIAAQFIKGENIEALIWEAARHWGSFQATADAIQRLHSVVVVRVDDEDLAYDIEFNLDDLPLNVDQEKLVNDVRRALTVVLVVLARKDKSTATRMIIPIVSSAIAAKAVRDNISSRRSDYIRKLAYIARVGLSSPGLVRFSNSLLESFKNDFVSREADFIKNRYVEVLGQHALVIGGIFLLVYGLADIFGVRHGCLHTYRSFLAMGAAACAGTWLSFSLRRVTLGFTDLANLDEDRLKPAMRLLFVVGLTWVIGVFLINNLVDFRIGNVPLAKELLTSGKIAVLLGVICGISERALASAVSRRSDDVLGTLGGQSSQSPSGTLPAVEAKTP